MRKIAVLSLAGIIMVGVLGCGSGSEDNLDKQAPPPGPNANLNPPTKKNRPPTPPTVASPGGGGQASK